MVPVEGQGWDGEEGERSGCVPRGETLQEGQGDQTRKIHVWKVG